jgi:putative transposase
MSMLTELRNRGVVDALIVCCDGLNGLPEAIRVAWPYATVQTCAVHLVRNSLRYFSKKYWGKIAKSLRRCTPRQPSRPQKPISKTSRRTGGRSTRR